MCMNPPVPFVCVSGWGLFLLCRWRPSLHCTLTQWWRDAGTGCCSGRWWTDGVSELHCSCLGYWTHSACGSLVHILQGAARINEPGSRRVEEMEHIWWMLQFISHRNLWTTSKCLSYSHVISPFSSPSHLSPCLTSPNSISPQWSQKAGARYECTLSAWGRIWKSSNVAAAKRHNRGRVWSQWVSRYNHTTVTGQDKEWLDG